MRNQPVSSASSGFSLVELMAAMTIGLIVISGVVGMFVSQVRVQNSDISRSELLADMQIASQIIRSELHFAKSVCWDSGTTTLAYQPLDSYTAIPAACAVPSGTVDQNGAFRLDSSASSIRWRKPSIGVNAAKQYSYDELMRNIKPTTGLQVSVDSYGVYQIDIYGQYVGEDHSTKEIATRITVWPRN